MLDANIETFARDDEMPSHTYRVLRGIEVNEVNLGFECICEAVLGEGHFLGGALTLETMERDYFYRTLADREHPRT